MKKILITLVILLCFVEVSLAATGSMVGRISGHMVYDFIPQDAYNVIAQVEYYDYCNYEGIYLNGRIDMNFNAYPGEMVIINMIPAYYDDFYDILVGVLSACIPQQGTDSIIYHLWTEEAFGPAIFPASFFLSYIPGDPNRLSSTWHWIMDCWWHGKETVGETIVKNSDFFFYLLF